jgi:hypothetical protein
LDLALGDELGFGLEPMFLGFAFRPAGKIVNALRPGGNLVVGQGYLMFGGFGHIVTSFQLVGSPGARRSSAAA